MTPTLSVTLEADLLSVDPGASPSHKSNQPSPEGGPFGGGSDAGSLPSNISVSEDLESEERWWSSSVNLISLGGKGGGESASGTSSQFGGKEVLLHLLCCLLQFLSGIF